MSAKLTLEDCQKLASRNEGLCISTEYVNNHTDLIWKCKNGHTWDTTYNIVQSGCWCPVCVGLAPKNLIFLQGLAKLKNGKCLATEYKNMSTYYQWQCEKDHIWEAKAYGVKQGDWCRRCSGTEPHDINWLHELARKKDGLCLSTVYVNNETHYTWQCCKGHTWVAIANAIQQDRWCPHCAGKAKHNVEWLQKLAIDKNGKCLATEYINIKTLYPWECEYEHIWEATAHNIQQGHWCPYCVHRHSQQEIEIYAKVKEVYPDALSGAKNLLTNKRFHLDIYVPSLRKAVEFDGPTHDPGHVLFELDNRDRDIRKNTECIQANIKLLRIDYKDYKANKEVCFSKIMEFLNN